MLFKTMNSCPDPTSQDSEAESLGACGWKSACSLWADAPLQL